MLRSIVLDGAYPLDGPDYAWYPSYAPAMREKFNLACRRSAACDAMPGSSIEHIQPAARALRADPFPARAADSDGQERAFTASASQLATVMFAAAPALATAREVDAAARAFAAGDRAPLLRLMAETASGSRFPRPHREPGRLERRSFSRRHVPRSAADLRHEARAHGAHRRSRPGPRRSPPRRARHLRPVHHR